MFNFYSVKDIKNILKENKISINKKLGQNFLIDSNICEKIAKSSFFDENCAVIEVGTGLGVLTYELSKIFKKVISIEYDRGLFEISRSFFKEYKNIEVINEDALKIDLNSLIRNKLKSFSKISICSNLPYYITTPLIMKFFELEKVEKTSVMIQRETAERLLSVPGSRLCGAISIAVRYYSNPRLLFNVSKSCFYPTPDVDSSVVLFDRIQRNDIQNKELFFKIVRSSFKERRKNILNSISSGIKISKNDLLQTLNLVGIDPNLRAENLSFQNFVDISNLLL